MKEWKFNGITKKTEQSSFVLLILLMKKAHMPAPTLTKNATKDFCQLFYLYFELGNIRFYKPEEKALCRTNSVYLSV